MARPTIQGTLAKLKGDVAALADAKVRREPLPLLPHQRDVYGWPGDPIRNLAYRAGRRTGKTVGAVMRLIEICRDTPEFPAAWIDIRFINLSRYWKRIWLPNLNRHARGQWSFNAHDQTLRFRNGSLVDFGSAENPQALEGFGYRLICCNEAGIILAGEPGESLYWNTLQPMLADNAGGKVWAIGTPKTPRGVFRTLWDRGADPLDTEWAAFHHDSYMNPTLNHVLIRRWANEMPSAVYRSEILAEWPEDGSGFFRNVAAVASGEAEAPEYGITYVVGLDVARLHDYCVVWVGRPDKRRAVACERWTGGTWPETIARVRSLAKRYNSAPVLMDATGLGDVVLSDLRGAGVAASGFTFTSQSKPEILMELASDIEHGRLSMIAHDQTLRELEAFERKALASGNFRYSAPSGGFDDCVCALALLNRAMGRPTDLDGGIFTVESRMSIAHNIEASLDPFYELPRRAHWDDRLS